MGHYFTNEQLPSDIKETTCVVLGNHFKFLTDNGVFSKDGLDFGSRLLLEVIPREEVGGKILDMGCGYGVFGIVLARVTSHRVDMVDVNHRALHSGNRIRFNEQKQHIIDDSGKNRKERSCPGRNSAIPYYRRYGIRTC